MKTKKIALIAFIIGIMLIGTLAFASVHNGKENMSNRPRAKVFIMSYCPYSLQFLKAYVPVMELLGNKADLDVNFVFYALHGKDEIDENTRMYCIEKEQKNKFAAYLRCFVESGDSESCIVEAGISESKIDSCMINTDLKFNITNLYNDKSTWLNGMFPIYPVDAELNEKYNIIASPTFILNGEEITVNRSAEEIKQSICATFKKPPAECSQQLSTFVELPGFGPIGG